MRALTLESRPRIGWGLLGAGGISDQLARALSYVPDARLVAVGSRDAAKARAFIDAPRGGESPREPVRAHGSYRALVEDPEVDVVYIGTPHPDHAPSMALALEAGKAVLCEKPFTVNRRQAEAAVALARRRGVFLMEAMWTRYVPAMVELKRLVDAGAIGEVVSTTADFGFAATGLPAEHRALNPALAGGGLLDVGIYPLSFAAFVLGPIAAVQADAELGPTGVDVHTVFNLRHANGRLSQGLCSLRSTTPGLAAVLGTHGRIDVAPPFYAAQRLELRRGTGPWEEQPVEVLDRPWRGNRYVPQIEEVHRCLRAGLAESPAMPLDESVALVGWMDTMRAQFGLRYPGE
ncbi:MAG TPA: Gfo/Idh/MocA family oxidoreductase [Burkholderiaceae bacterium]